MEGSFELGLSVLPSGSHLEIESLIFSGTQDGVRGPCGAVCDRAIFLKINYFLQIWANE